MASSSRCANLRSGRRWPSSSSREKNRPRPATAVADPIPLQPLPPPRPATPPARRTGSPYPKAALLPRAVARASDLTLALLLSSFPGKAGVLAALLYLLVADAL